MSSVLLPLPWCLPARIRFGEGRGEDGGGGVCLAAVTRRHAEKP